MQHLGSEEEMEQALLDVFRTLPQHMINAVLSPEQRLAGLAPEQRLQGMTPEELVQMRKLLQSLEEKGSSASPK